MYNIILDIIPERDKFPNYDDTTSMKQENIFDSMREQSVYLRLKYSSHVLKKKKSNCSFLTVDLTVIYHEIFGSLKSTKCVLLCFRWHNELFRLLQLF